MTESDHTMQLRQQVTDLRALLSEALAQRTRRGGRYANCSHNSLVPAHRRAMPMSEAGNI